MQNEIAQARTSLSKVSQFLKQENIYTAVQTVRKALGIFTTKSMLRNEQEEFERLIDNACKQLDTNQQIRVLFPLSLAYTPGKGKELLTTLDELMEIIDSEFSSDVPAAADEDKKQKGLAKGEKELADGQTKHAEETFSMLSEEYPADAALAGNIAEIFMASGFYEQAAKYFENAAAISPEDVHTLNRLGIALRKKKDFSLSESTFNKALILEPENPHLHFNISRLYFDWKNLDKALASAEKACELAPHFTEAAKLKNYLKKQA